MRVYLCQPDIAWEDPGTTHTRVRELAAGAAGPGLLVLPEMFASGFSMAADRVAEPPDGPSARFLADVARDRGLHVVGGIATRRQPRPRNEAVAIAPDGTELARYAKIKSFPLTDEAAHYAPGRDVRTFSCLGAGLAMFICYDLRFPELFRAATSLAAQVFVVVANWPAARADHWRALLRARAIDNQAFVVGVNRCGADPHATYAGGSIAVGPRGEVLRELGDRPELAAVDLDLEDLRAWRRDFPLLADR